MPTVWVQDPVSSFAVQYVSILNKSSAAENSATWKYKTD